MRQLRTQFEIKPGVKVDALFTPHLYSYKGVNGVTFEPRDDSVVALLESYADVMYSAALNAWELDGRGTVDNFPHKRGDFHEWMTADAKGFGDAINFALAALTGKTASELSKENSNQKPDGKKKTLYLDWPEIEAFLIGQCSMTERQAALTSYPEYQKRLEGYTKKERARWELARWVLWQQMLMSPNIKPAHKPKTAKGYCKFPWEQETPEELMQKAQECKITPEQEAELNEIIKILDKD